MDETSDDAVGALLEMRAPVEIPKRGRTVPVAKHPNTGPAYISELGLAL